MTRSRSSSRIAALAALAVLLSGRRRRRRRTSAVRQFSRQSVQPRRAGQRSRAQQQPQPAPPGRVAQSDPGDLSVRLDRMESALRQLTGTIEQLQYRNQQLEMQLKRMQDDTDIACSNWARGRGRAAAAGRAARPGAERAAACANMPGRRSDVFDPSQHPNAPGAPRTLGNQAAIAAPEPTQDNGSAGRRAGRPRRRRAARSVDAGRQ